jgi:hypothetical protein
MIAWLPNSNGLTAEMKIQIAGRYHLFDFTHHDSYLLVEGSYFSETQP